MVFATAFVWLALLQAPFRNTHEGHGCGNHQSHTSEQVYDPQLAAHRSPKLGLVPVDAAHDVAKATSETWGE